MTKFEIPDWEKNSIGDHSCKEISQVRSDASGLKNQKKGKLKSKISTVSKIIKKDKAFNKINKHKKQHIAEIRKITINTTPQIVKNVTNKNKKSVNGFGKKLKQDLIKIRPHHNIDTKMNKKTNKPLNLTPNKVKEGLKNIKLHKADPENTVAAPIKTNKNANKLRKFKQKLENMEENKPSLNAAVSLHDRMLAKLKAARFRYLNEEIYSTESKHAVQLFKEDPDAFHAYHEGYRQQIAKWPLNPLDTIINSISKMPQTHIVADFGCGEARLAKSIKQKVHSFDLVAANDSVVACDMARVPLKGNSVNVVVFCLSLMGTNLKDYLMEANRILKIGGILKIAEVESRFDRVETFMDGVKRIGFSNTWKDLSHNLFYFLDFKKDRDIKNKNKIPVISLQPCLYKKR